MRNMAPDLATDVICLSVLAIPLQQLLISHQQLAAAFQVASIYFIDGKKRLCESSDGSGGLDTQDFHPASAFYSKEASTEKKEGPDAVTPTQVQLNTDIAT